MTTYEELGKLKSNRSATPDRFYSFTESILFIEDAVNKEFNQIFESVGFKELDYIRENGTQIIYEKVSFKQIIDSIVEALKRAWRAVKGLYEKIEDKFNERTDKKSQNYKLSDSIIKAIPDRVDMGKVNDFSGIDELLSRVENKKESLDNTLDKIKRVKRIRFEQEDFDDFCNSIVKTLLGIDKEISCANKSDIKKEVEKICIGDPVDVTKEWLLKNYTNINKAFDKGMSSLNQSYRQDKLAFSSAIDNIKQLSADENESTVFVSKAELNLTLAYSAVHMAIMDCQIKRFNQYLAISIGKVNANVKESTDITDMVNECFNW